MKVEFRVLSWNVGGAMYLALPTDEQKSQYREQLNKHVNELVERYTPDVVALQEIVEFSMPGKPRQTIVTPPSGYVLQYLMQVYFFCK